MFSRLPVFLIVVLSFLTIAHSDPSASDQQTDLPETSSLAQTTQVSKSVSIDVFNIPTGSTVFIADPITLSLATDTLTLRVYSSVYPNTYPDSMGNLFGDESTFYRFDMVESNKIDSSILFNSDSDIISSTELNFFHFVPRGVGTVTLEFCGDVDLNLSKGFLKEQRIKHITVQVPINVVE